MNLRAERYDQPGLHDFNLAIKDAAVRGNVFWIRIANSASRLNKVGDVTICGSVFFQE